MKKGLTRLIFLVVFFIPVTWYLFLQFFGTNSFTLELQSVIEDSCGPFDKVVIVTRVDSVSLAKQNYLDRVRHATDRKSISLLKEHAEFFACINQNDAELVMIDEKGLWGSYELSRDGVDRLLTELDILLLQKSYGQGTRR